MRGEPLLNIVSAEEWTALFVLSLRDGRHLSIRDGEERNNFRRVLRLARLQQFRGLNRVIRIEAGPQGPGVDDNDGVSDRRDGGQIEVNDETHFHLSHDSRVDYLYRYHAEDTEGVSTEEGSDSIIDSSDVLLSNSELDVQFRECDFGAAELIVVESLRRIDDDNRVQNGGNVVYDVLADAQMAHAIEVALAGRSLDNRPADSRFWSPTEVTISQFEYRGRQVQFSPEISNDLVLAFSSADFGDITIKRLMEFVAYNRSYNISNRQKLDIITGTAIHALDRLSVLDNWAQVAESSVAKQKAAFGIYQRRFSTIKGVLEPFISILDLLRKQSVGGGDERKTKGNPNRGTYPLVTLFNLLYGIFGEKKLRPAKAGFLFRLTH